MVTAEPVAPGLHRVEKVLGYGWSLSMHVAALPDGGVLVYSPTWCGDGTFEAVDALGEVRAIVAPNHFHHLSLARFRERYPAARAVAGPAAHRRLAQKGHAGLGVLDDVAGLLPAGARLVEVAEARSGEAWLVLPGEPGPVLVVGDAFFHVTRPVRGVPGWMLRRMKVVPDLCFGWTTKRFVVGDRAGFRADVETLLARDRPTTLAPSHGAALSDPALADLLVELLDRRLALR